MPGYQRHVKSRASNGLLRAASTKPNNWFQQILFSIGPFKSNNRREAFRIVQSLWCHLSLRQWWASRFLQPGKNYYSLASTSCLIRHILLTWHHQTSIYSDLCKIPSIVKISILWRPAKSTLSFSKTGMFWEDGIFKLSERPGEIIEQNGAYI